MDVGRVLIVAGSDPSGGAGIQADIKTVTMMGGYAAAAITALTVQNTKGVTVVEGVGPDMVYAQIMAVLDDIGADVIKTGMLLDKPTIEAVIRAIEDSDYQGRLVVDPVMVATSGAKLLDDSAIAIVRDELLPLAQVITPNIPEAEVLTGLTIKDADDMKSAGVALMQMGASAVLVKGGHLSGDRVTDILLTTDGTDLRIDRPKIVTRHTHGTGCTLASAIAAASASGHGIDQCVKLGVAFVDQAIKAAPELGKGNGPLGHAAVDRSLM